MLLRIAICHGKPHTKGTQSPLEILVVAIAQSAPQPPLSVLKVLQPEEVAPGAVQATPRPPMPKANQLEPKRARMARWKKDPSEMEKDMAKQREALKKAEEEDEQVHQSLTPCF